MEKIAKCIKETSNWSKLEAEHRFDHPKFSAQRFLNDVKVSAPKLWALLEKIKELDARDLKQHGKVFKHFIYSDVKSAYGAKLIASALAAIGIPHAYGLEKTSRGMSFVLKKDLKSAFATLTSVSFFEKNIGVNFRKELLGVFNSRPDNVYGDKIRFIILDSGFREGVDLFDVKYVHLFEPIITRADEKQAVGRATRFCGQKGLPFDKKTGWPIHVFKYETEIPKRIQYALLSEKPELAPCGTFFELFLKFSNIDPKKINFANDIEPLIIMGAVDRYLNRNVHNFAVSRDDENVNYNIFEGGVSPRKLTKFQSMQKLIRKDFLQYAWPPTKIENGCATTPALGAHAASSSPVVVEFSPTQNFIRNFFTTKSPYKGMLLMHSVGTGKTCSAIAVASSSFEKEDYTIIYVTRHTLKGDVWKNMFGLTCNVIIQNMIKQGVSVPEAESRRRQLIRAWMEPMSYKQFSNMLAGKSQLYDELVKRNGKADPLKKTLVIIDEAHKLHAPDVTGAEKPDVETIRKALHTSYKKSGKDSARLLLMTATPYTDDPLDMIKLLNLCREDHELLPEEFDAFSQRFLDTKTGKFTDTGKWQFLDEITGFISYLNREKDVRSFSYPIFENVVVPMSEYEFEAELKEVISTKAEWLNLEDVIRDKQSDLQKSKTEYRLKVLKDLEINYAKYKNRYLTCIQGTADEKTFAKQSYENKKKVCNAVAKDCEAKVAEKLKKDSAELRAWAKAKTAAECKKRGDKECREAIKNELKEKLDTLKEEAKFDKKQCGNNSEKQKCLDDAKSEYDNAIRSIEQKCKRLKEHMELEKTQYDQEVNTKVDGFSRHKQQVIDEYKKRADEKRRVVDSLQKGIAEKLKTDRSQRLKLEGCLKDAKVKPHWDNMLKGKFFSHFDDTLMNDEDILGTAKEDFLNVYMINGHGSEHIESFDERFVLPDDKILVAFPVCGRPNYLDKICNFADVFQDPEKNKLLLNPLVFKSEIERLGKTPIRIYLPGDKVPNMSTTLFMNFNLRKTVIMKSGVFKLNKIPQIDRTKFKGTTDMRLSLGSSKCFKYTGIIDDPSYYDSVVHREVFKGNVYKPGGVMRPYNDLNHRMITIKEIMDEIGPGIYYFTGCRSSFEDIPVGEYEKILNNSAKQQDKPGRQEAIRDFHKKYIKGSVSEDDIVDVVPLDEKKKIQVKLKEKNKEEEKKQQEEVPPKIKVVVRSRKGEMTKIKKELKALMSNVPDDKKMTIKKLQEWIKVVEIQEPRDDKLLQMLTDFVEILNGSDQVKTVHAVNQTTKQNTIYLYGSIKSSIGTRKYVLNRRLLGVIPRGETDLVNKCDTDTVVKKIKGLVKKGVGKNVDDVLPKNEDEWNNAEDREALFRRICVQVKKM